MIPIPFIQRHASIFAVVITLAIVWLFMPEMALWLQVLAAMVLSVVVWGLLYKRGVTPRRRKGALFRTSVEETDHEETFR